MVFFFNFLSHIWFISVLLHFACSPRMVQARQQELQVYTYQSFLNAYGPGQDLKRLFEKKCDCQLQWRGFSDTGGMVGQALFEGKRLRADLLLGVDYAQFLQIKSRQLQQKKLSLTPPSSKVSGLGKLLEDGFAAYDYGFFTLMQRGAQESKASSIYEFLTSLKGRSLVLQDPRLSSPGKGFLAWLAMDCNDDQLKERIKQIRTKILTVAPGWPESYALFQKGEADYVFSYTLSEAYHRQENPKTQYRAVHFLDGHLMQIEGLLVNKNSLKKNLALKFLEFIWTDEAQKIIAEKNYMYPISESAMQSIDPTFKEVFYPKQWVLQEHNTNRWQRILDIWNTSMATL